MRRFRLFPLLLLALASFFALTAPAEDAPRLELTAYAPPSVFALELYPSEIREYASPPLSSYLSDLLRIGGLDGAARLRDFLERVASIKLRSVLFAQGARPRSAEQWLLADARGLQPEESFRALTEFVGQANLSRIADVPLLSLESVLGVEAGLCIVDGIFLLGPVRGMESAVPRLVAPNADRRVAVFDSLPAWKQGTLFRAAVDLNALGELQPQLRAVFGAFGANDAKVLTVSAGREGRAVRESVSLACSSPFEGISALLRGPAKPVEFPSSVPDTAAVYVRANLDPCELIERFLVLLAGFDRGAVDNLNDVAESLGIGGFSVLASILAPGIEVFLDHPRGAILPDFVAALPLSEQPAAEELLANIVRKRNLERISRGGCSFAVVPQRLLPHDFPWGLCACVHDRRFVIASNVDAALRALDRAGSAPLKSEGEYVSAFAGHSPGRTLEGFVRGSAFASLANVLRFLSKSEVSKASLPVEAEDRMFPAAAVSLGGEGAVLELRSQGPITPALVVFTVFFRDRLAALTAKALEKSDPRARAVAAYAQLRLYYQMNRVVPFNVGDLLGMRGFDPRPFLPAGYRVPAEGIGAEELISNCVYHLFAGLNPERDAALPVLLTKQAVDGSFIGCSMTGEFLSIPPQRIQRVLDMINQRLGTAYSVEGEEIRLQ
jgi:hypothetical protein